MRDRSVSVPATRTEGLRITQLVLSNAFAGTEQHVALLSRELSALGVHVRVVCGDRNEHLIDEVSGGGVEVCPLRLGKGNLPIDWGTAYHAVVGWGARLVHAHLGSSLLCGTLLTARGRAHLVFTQHFIRSAYREATGLRKVARAVAHRVVHGQVACGLATTRFAQMEMVEDEGFTREKTAVIPLGIDVCRIAEQAQNGARDARVELDLPHHAILLVTPARLEQEKGHETLLASLPLVIAQHPNTYLLLAGTGTLEPRLKQQLCRRLDGRVRFLGHRTDVPRLLAQAALCVLPSYEEPFGLVLLEAMALGRPVVACNSGGPREIVVHGETGLLVPPHNPQALAEAIMTVLDNPLRAHAMGVAGQRRVIDHFSARHMAEQTLLVYHQAMEP